MKFGEVEGYFCCYDCRRISGSHVYYSCSDNDKCKYLNEKICFECLNPKFSKLAGLHCFEKLEDYMLKNKRKKDGYICVNEKIIPSLLTNLISINLTGKVFYEK